MSPPKPKSSKHMPARDYKPCVELDNSKPEQPKPGPIVECPPELGVLARMEWDRVVGPLAATGVLCHFDRAALALYCTSYGSWIEASQAIQKDGAVMKSPSGYPVQSPHVAIANKQAAVMLQAARELGFTPAARGRRWMLSKSDPKLLELEDLD